MFKPVKEFEGIYEVDESGVVRTCEGKMTHSSRHGVRKWKQRILKQKTDRNGYKRVNLYKGKKSHTCLVHRLVADAFLNNEQSHPMVNHKDGDVVNNHVSNLEWCDARHNVNHAFDLGLMNSRQVTLTEIGTSDTLTFRSMSDASKFLGRNRGYVSSQVSKGIYTMRGYKVSIH